MNNSPVDKEPLPSAPQPAPAQQVTRVPFPFSPPRLTFIIIGITIFFYILQVASVGIYGYAVYQLDWLELFGARINDSIRAGQVWRLITPILLHGSLTHILFNMYSLYSLGSQLEKFYGYKRFILLYLLAGFAGNAFSFLVGPQDGISIGASTSIFGLAAAEGVFLFQNRKILGEQARSGIGNIFFVVALNLFVLGNIPGIDNWGHIGGLLGGLIFSWMAGPIWAVEGIHPNIQIVDKREPREFLISAVTVLVFFSILTISGILFS